MPQHIDIHAMNLGELETEVLRKLWITTSEDTNGFSPDAAFAKYSRYRVRKKINKNYTELVALTNALRSWFIVTLEANYTQYPVPLNCYDIESVYYFSSATTYSELEMYEESTIQDILSPGWRTQTGIPQYAYVADRNKMVVKLGIVPAPLTSGTAITLGSSVYSGTSPHGTMDGVAGVAGVVSTGLVYVDSSAQNFTQLGITVGLTILNLSDGSKGVITSITTTVNTNDTITCASFSEGSLNTWTPGDEMRVLGGEYGGMIEIGDTEAQYILSPTMGRLPQPGVTMAAGNLLVRGFMLPILLTEMHQYPELSPMFHYGIALGAAADLGLEEPMDSPEFNQAQVYRKDFNESMAALSSFSATQYKQGAQLWSRRS